MEIRGAITAREETQEHTPSQRCHANGVGQHIFPASSYWPVTTGRVPPGPCSTFEHLDASQTANYFLDAKALHVFQPNNPDTLLLRCFSASGHCRMSYLAPRFIGRFLDNNLHDQHPGVIVSDGTPPTRTVYSPST